MHRQKIEFTFICDDEEKIKEAIHLYNEHFKTNFELVKFEYDEVHFATISGDVRFHDIFDLGAWYGTIIERTR